MSDRPNSSSLQTVAQREAALLAPYALHSADSAGRKHAEAEHPYRGPFQRDRDRIVHSSAYRRLSGKMQVFTGDRGDYHRTRLTHTHEVASIARTVGRALRLNEDLVEALALLHDVGHPPFGHAGEDALAECLAADGGFSHNRYALTLVEELESRYPQFPGLNLSLEVLAGQTTRIDKSATGLPRPLLEVQVVEAADSITYDAHDIDDAVKLGLVTLADLEQVPLVQVALARIQARHGRLEGHFLRMTLVHELLDYQVGDLLARSAERLAANAPASAEAGRRLPESLGAGPVVAAQKKELEAFLYERVYRHEQLVQVRKHAQLRLQSLFDFFLEHPDEMPRWYQARINLVGSRRAVGDYLAGMTDRFCDEQYRQHIAGK